MKAYTEIIRKYYKYQYQDWTQPILTANGIIGQDHFAVSSDSVWDSGFDRYKAFDGNTGTYWLSQANVRTGSYYFYNPNPLNITKLENLSSYNIYVYTASCTLYGSNNNKDWVELGQSESVGSLVFAINIPDNTEFYKYYKITVTAAGSNGWGFGELAITATEQVVAEATEADYDFYKDVNIYKLPKEIVRKYYKYQEEYRTFVQPVLTSNGILGGDSFAVDSNTLYLSSYPAWNAFDGTKAVWWGNSGDAINYYIMYNPNPLNIKNINIKNYNGDGASLSGYWYSSSGSVYGSNDGVEWITIKQYNNDISAYNATWDINLVENTNYYKYYKIDSNSYHPFDSEGWSIQEIILTADEETRILIESDESNYDFYKDVETYYGIGD